jgi:hypothetical protein
VSQKDPSNNALSVTALAIGSVSSMATAVVVHEFWQAGAILGAAVTPVLLAVFNELLRRPVDRIHVRTVGHLAGPRPVRVATTAGAGGQVRVYRARPRWGKALLTASTAFVLGVTVLTAAELVLDRSIADKRDRTTLFDTKRASEQTPPTSTPATKTPEPSTGHATDPTDRKTKTAQPDSRGKATDKVRVTSGPAARPSRDRDDRKSAPETKQTPAAPAETTTPTAPTVPEPPAPTGEELPREPSPPEQP